MAASQASKSAMTAFAALPKPPPGLPPGSPPNLPAEALGSDELLRLIFDHASEGICVFDAALRLQAWNQHFLSLTRLDPAVARRGAPLQTLLLALARAGEFGAVDAEAEVQRRLGLLNAATAAVTEHIRADGRTLELRRSPTPGGGFVTIYADITDRKAAAATLADQQRMRALLIEATEQGIWFIDNALCTTDANPAMCRMLGLALPQLLGRGIYEFVDEANERIFREHVLRRAQGQAEGYEIALLRADGTEVHCYNNATPIFNAAGAKVGAVGMFSDITPLKRAEQQTRHTSELLAQKSRVLEVTLDNLSQGVLSVGADGRTNAYNRRFLDLVQVPLALMQTRPTLQALTAHQRAQGQFGDQLERLDAAGREGLRRFLGGDPRALTPSYQRTRPDGVVLDVQTHAAADGSVVRTYTDVTVAVLAQQALQTSEARFRSMADAAPALIWQSDPLGNPTWFNQRWLQYTGRTLAQELALSWGHRLRAEDIERTRAVFAAAGRSGTPYQTEFCIECSDGRLAWIVDQGIPCFTAAGRFEGFIVYGWDITERKAAEAALIAAKEEAERANRAKSEFLSRMSHELRTPLNAVLGFGQLMGSDAADPLSPSQGARLQELLRGGRHLLSLINDVLDLARIEAGTLHLALAPVDLQSLVDDCLRLVQAAAAERHITIVASPGPADTCRVLADPTRLKQVLLNLLSNAIKYNHAGGSVQVAWQREDGPARDGRGGVRIDVIDNGPGLSTHQQERLFHAFERLEAARSSVEGAGIGLALSKWLVDLMQGQIGVASTPGAGSRFWLTLQQAGGAEPAGLAAPAPAVADGGDVADVVDAKTTVAQHAPERRHTVIYIEDNEVNQLLMEGMLAQRPGIRLLMAGLPLPGLALAACEPPDLVLLDIQLPGMDGFEVLKRLRAAPATRHVPVVAVSANAMPADRQKAAEAGFIDYITKPIDLPLLLATVDRLLPV